MPKGKNHTPELIVGILRRMAHGETAEAVCRDVNISEATLCRWKQQYGALELDEVKELKARREENAQLKRVVADQALNIHVLKIVNAKKWRARRNSATPAKAWWRRASVRSVRRACYLGLARSTWAYQRRPPTPRAQQIADGIVRLSRRHLRYGYRRVHALLLREGLVCARRSLCVGRKACASVAPPAARTVRPGRKPR